MNCVPNIEVKSGASQGEPGDILTIQCVEHDNTKHNTSTRPHSDSESNFFFGRNFFALPQILFRTVSFSY